MYKRSKRRISWDIQVDKYFGIEISNFDVASESKVYKITGDACAGLWIMKQTNQRHMNEKKEEKSSNQKKKEKKKNTPNGNNKPKAGLYLEGFAVAQKHWTETINGRYRTRRKKIYIDIDIDM